GPHPLPPLHVRGEGELHVRHPPLPERGEGGRGGEAHRGGPGTPRRIAPPFAVFAVLAVAPRGARRGASPRAPVVGASPPTPSPHSWRGGTSHKSPPSPRTGRGGPGGVRPLQEDRRSARVNRS